ncbi:hypothetical protein IAT38_002724 [Cryptococcus sp. DSM 104549]
MPALSFLPFLQTVPLATRLITATFLVFTLAALALDVLARQNSPSGLLPGEALPWLVLSPGKSLVYPWTFLTAGFVELNFINLIVSAISLPLACRYLERVWGPRELVRFCVITIVGSNIIAFGFSWIVWFVIGSEDSLYGVPYHGLSGLQVGFLVAFTQLIPEHQVQLLGKFKVRVKTLPGIHLLISNVLVILIGPSPYMLIQFGFFVAWAYLRFFKLSENGEIRGDRSETFAFQYWFPPPVRPYISVAANQVFKLATRVHLVQPWDEATSGNAGAYSLLPGPGGARAEAERRRQLAIKALDARLASSSPAPSAPGTSTPVAPAGISAGAVGSSAGAAPAGVSGAESESKGEEEKVKV